MANRTNHANPALGQGIIKGKDVWSIVLRNKTTGQIGWPKEAVAPHATVARTVIDLGSELLQDRILPAALMMEHKEKATGETHFIYDMPIVRAFGRETDKITYPSAGWFMGLAKQIGSVTEAHIPEMLHHNDVIAHPDQYKGKLEPFMFDAIRDIDWKTRCRTNNVACETHNYRSRLMRRKDMEQGLQQKLEAIGYAKRPRLCAKIVPRNVHDLNTDIIVRHRISAHQHGSSKAQIINNDTCLVCQTANTWIVPNFFLADSEAMKDALKEEASEGGIGQTHHTGRPRRAERLAPSDSRYGVTNENRRPRHVHMYMSKHGRRIPTIRVAPREGGGVPSDKKVKCPC